MALSKEFYLEEIKSKYPNSYNKSLEDLPVKDLEDMLDFLDEALGKADGGSIGIEVLFGPKVPAAPSQLVEESEIVLGYRGDDAARSDRASGRSAGRADPGGSVDRSAVSGGSQYAKNVAAQNNKPSFKKKVKSVVTNPAVQALGGALLTGGINLAAPGALEKLNKARMISNVLKYGKDIAVEDELESITKTGGISPYADGGRVGLFMGGPALEGQALQIYNSMNAYGFSDQEIADALSARGLYTAPGSGTGTETTQSNIIGAQLDQGGGGGGITELQETFTRAAGSTPKFSQDAFFGLGKFLQGKERGTLGTRLANQPRLPLPASIAAYSMSPFNPDSKNYNPDFADQLNFLELGDDMIGMSGTGLKHGSGSVLAGQNVISGFGSNNYLTQLNKYINRKNITDKARQKGIDERNAFLAAQEKKNQERIAAERAAGAAANQAMQRQAGGGGGGNLTRSRSQGGLGLSASQAQAVSAANQAAGMGGFGLKEGGLATMFTRRR